MKAISILIFGLLIASCSSSKLISIASDGTLSKEEYNEEFKFQYKDGHIYVDVEINGHTYTFLFDTGYDISMVDRDLLDSLDFTLVKKFKTGGNSFESVYLKYGFIPSLKLDKVSYRNIGIGIQDLTMIESPFEDKRKIMGVIGTNILRKSYWQIDYKEQLIRYASSLEDLEIRQGSKQVDMIPRNSSNWGLNRIALDFEGIQGLFVFDTGSSGGMTINPEFSELLINHNPELYAMQKPAKGNRSFIDVENIKLGGMDIEEERLWVGKKGPNLIGNRTLESYLVTIDWKENKLYLTEQ